MLWIPENNTGEDVALYFWPSALIREFITVFASRRFFPWAVLGYLLFISPIVVALIRQRRLTHYDRSC